MGILQRFILIFLVCCTFFLSTARADGHPQIFRYVIGFVLKDFIDVEKLNPKKMFEAGLRKVELVSENFFFSVKEEGSYTITLEDQTKQINIPLTSSPKQVILLILNLEMVFEFITEHYKGEKPIDDLRVACINGMLETLDPHSNAFTEKEWNEFNTQLEGEIYGVGMYLDVRNGRLFGSNPIPGGPAYKTGVMHGDEIIQINAESAINITAEQAVSKIRGPKGSTVVLTIMRKGEIKPRIYSIVRDRIEIKSVASFLLPSQVGYIKISTFSDNTYESFISKLYKLGPPEKLKGLIIDLRYNGGGLLDQAILISDYFIEKGHIVSVYNGKEITQRYVAEKDKTEPAYPICVLANEHSASGSEVLAGALQKNDRAFILGEKTFGKGTMQRPYPLKALDNVDLKKADLSGPFMKLTIGEYLIPQDISIQSVGLTPDIETKSVTLTETSPDLIPDEPLITEKEFQSPLVSKFNVSETSSFQIPYLYQKMTDEELEIQRNAFITEKFDFSKDEEVLIAEQLILGAILPFDRNTFLKKNAPQIRQILTAHQKILMEELQKISVDWTAGESAKNPSLTTKLTWDIKPQTKEDLEYQELSIHLSVTNKGEEPIHRLKGLTKSRYLRFKNGEFLFGLLKPGQTITRTLKFNLSKFTQGSQWNLDVVLSDEKKTLETVQTRVLLKDVAPPSFSFQSSLWSEGKEVTSLQKDQDVEVRVKVKNIGEGVCAKGIASFTHSFGADIFLEKGRVDLERLEPGQSQEIAFKFKVKGIPSVEKEGKKKSGKNKAFSITLYDLLSDAFLTQSFDFPVQGTAEKEWNGEQVWNTPIVKLEVSPLNAPFLAEQKQVHLKAIVTGNHLKSVSVLHRYRPEPNKPFYQTKKVYFGWAKDKSEFQLNHEILLEEGMNNLVVIVSDQKGTRAIKDYLVLKK